MIHSCIGIWRILFRVLTEIYWSILRKNWSNLNHQRCGHKYATLISYLKRQSIGYKPKKCRTLKKIYKYKFILNEPANVMNKVKWFWDKWFWVVLMKVVLIMGVADVCRREELYNHWWHYKSDVINKISESKTYIWRLSFTNIGDNGINNIDFLEDCRNYTKLENVETTHFFLTYRNGRCTR